MAITQANHAQAHACAGHATHVTVHVLTEAVVFLPFLLCSMHFLR